MGFSYRSCLLVAACTFGFAGSALAADLAGTWQGNYSCGVNRDTAFTLDLQQSDSKFDGTFRFAAPNAQDKGGAYKVSGSIDAKGAFTFVPREWIERPTGYTALGLVGRLRDNGLMIGGTMPGCGGIGDNFTATRNTAAAPSGNAAAANTPVCTAKRRERGRTTRRPTSFRTATNWLRYFDLKH